MSHRESLILTNSEFGDSERPDSAVPLVDAVDPVPTQRDIVAYGKAATLPVHWLTLRKGTAEVAHIPVVVEDRRVNRVALRSLSLAGYDFFDYNAIACETESWPQALQRLSDFARQKRCDAIFLNNVVGAIPERAGWRAIERTRFFDPAKDPESWQGVLRKKSIVRHYNKARRELAYRCDTHVGRIDPALFDRLARLHVERWKFDGVESPLSAIARRTLYAAIDDCVLTVIWDGDEILAAHYGLKFANTLIWHTPIANIRYWDYSPVELLLREVAGFCQSSNAAALDFGLGGETYKGRFSNSERAVYELLHPLSLRGRLAAAVHRFDTDGLKQSIGAAIDLLRTSRDRLRAFRNRVKFFVAGPTTDAGPDAIRNGYCEIDSFARFVELARRSGWQPKRFQYDRFRQGDLFICIAGNDGIVSSGWVRRSGRMVVGEKRWTLAAQDADILYDFLTAEAVRSRGYYSSLLRSYRANHPGRKLLIYALAGLTASLKGIGKAGFTEISAEELRQTGLLERSIRPPAGNVTD